MAKRIAKKEQGEVRVPRTYSISRSAAEAAKSIAAKKGMSASYWVESLILRVAKMSKGLDEVADLL